MRKSILTLTLLAGLALCGCGLRASGDPPVSSVTDGQPADTGLSEPGGSGPAEPGRTDGVTSPADPAGTDGVTSPADPKGNGTGNAASPAEPKGNGAGNSGIPDGTRVTQGGPYGEISLTLPDGWDYEPCPVDSGPLPTTLYGIRFYPESAAEGRIEISWSEWFGVCGTGLSEVETTIAGCPAWIGTYDNQPCWDFIIFQEGCACDGLVIQTYSVGSWWDDYEDDVAAILDTISFDPDLKEGSIYRYSSDSDLSEAALWLSLKDITPTGATLVFQQYDAEAPTGELSYGEDFSLERLQNNAWTAVPVAVQGNYAFDAVAHLIPVNETTEQELDWSWLYGELPPGEYRIRKTVLDLRDSGDSDRYEIYAHFILN